MQERRNQQLKIQYEHMKQNDIRNSQIHSKGKGLSKPQHDPFISNQTYDEDIGLPNVIVIVSDNVKLIRNNSVPMLQCQIEIIQDANSYGNDMCVVGLNDVIYLVPEFTPAEYFEEYPKISTGNEFEDFKPFFDHYELFNIKNKKGEKDMYGIPERMKNLFKNSMTAIERDYYEPELRGRAFINLKNLPNGHYTVYYLRIGQPISINSKLKVLGQVNGVFVNIDRDKISDCKKPQLDFNHSSSRISKSETSKFKILKAQ